MKRLPMFSFIVVIAMLSGCEVMPTGPSVMVLPGDNKSFDQFRSDDMMCRQYAYEQVGGVQGQQAAQSSAVASAAVGTAVGAAAGAIIGSASGDAGAGAAIGAGSGLIFGSAVGSGTSSQSYYATQRRYDTAYMQCMYAKGHLIPGVRRITRTTDSAPAPMYYYPPPPPGYPAPAD
ncbi:MAG: glycine zipper family protein [Desulfobacterales bacterium]|jgi:hypothetical protein|nr:glycine zipper family protein [Desulfobacterales bacterium]MDD3951495.1 glycine zipper family protein [Desulfobacterales bacterium]